MEQSILKLDLSRLSNKKYLINYLKNNRCFLSKKLGQNFLISAKIIHFIVDNLNLTNEDIVIEIGPGMGVVTVELLKKTKKLICIELDNKLGKILEKNFKNYENLTLIKGDALKTDFKLLIKKLKAQNGISGKIKIFSNLPYAIATPLIIKLLENDLHVQEMLFTVQKELAERFTAKPKNKNYSASSVILQANAHIKIIQDIPKEKFFPKPKIESSIIVLKENNLLSLAGIDPKKAFSLFVKNCFAHRRKTLYNSLHLTHKYKEENLKIIFKKYKLKPNLRAEELSVEDFIKLYKQF